MPDDLLPAELAIVGESITDDQLGDPAGFDLEPIADDQWAEWAGRRLAAAHRRLDEVADQATAWIARIREWEDYRSRTDQRIVERLTESLRQYAVATRLRDGRATVMLPSVTVATTLATEAHVDVVDEKAVLAWTETLDAMDREVVVRTRRSVLVTGLRARVAIRETEDGDRYVVGPDGDLVPGVAIVDPEPKARVSLPKTD